MRYERGYVTKEMLELDLDFYPLSDEKPDVPYVYFEMDETDMAYRGSVICIDDDGEVLFYRPCADPGYTFETGPCRPLGYTDMEDAAKLLLKKRAASYDPGTRPEAR